MVWHCKQCYKELTTQFGRGMEKGMARKLSKQLATFCDTCERQSDSCF